MVRMINRLWDERPMTVIMGLAILFRLLAAIFAKGWGMLDDHFIVIESSGSWAADEDYNNWLPGSPGNHGPTGHNMFYPGLHYLLFLGLRFFGLHDPQGQMVVVRMLHAALSLVTVYYGYRIAEKLSGKESARISGMLLAILWFMPWMSVRNLVEMTCVPFILAGYWMFLRDRQVERPVLSWFLSGILFGLAVNIRPQTLLFPIGIGALILFRRQWKQLAALAGGIILTLVAIQGGIDLYLWGYPFAELREYFRINVVDRYDYITLPWYNYFLTVLGLLLPPVSLLLFYGFIRSWKKYLLLFLPAVIYFAVHSYFPNKQERFILPMVPLFIIAGTMGWQEFRTRSSYWAHHRRLLRGMWGFFWIVNLILLLAFTFTYSKKARVEAMTYLSQYRDIRSLVVVDEANSPELMPRFYLGQWPVFFNSRVREQQIDTLLHYAQQPAIPPPPFILFTGDQGIQPMVIRARQYFPYLVYETTIEPGNIDRFIHWLNPINKNRRIFIYRNLEVPVNRNP